MRLPLVSNNDPAYQYVDPYGISHPIGDYVQKNAFALNESAEAVSSIEAPTGLAIQRSTILRGAEVRAIGLARFGWEVTHTFGMLMQIDGY